MTSLPDHLGRYRLSRFIRAGNSCQLWEATKADGSGRCVLKVLRRDHWGNREQIDYLKHEYEVAHGLSHPNVLRVYEFGTEGKIAFLVIEAFSSTNLKQVLREDQTKILRNFQKIVEQSASGLEHLHEKRWVHCDVKPDNFLLNDEGTIKLIDFSIAQRAAGGFLGRLFGKRGKPQGTRSYMSPEQIRGQRVDARSDIYSFGCTLYELLTNKLPYTGVNPDDLLNKHLRGAVPHVLVHNNLVTAEFADLVRRMMAKVREQRPQSMGAVLNELRSMRPFKPGATFAGATPEDGK